MRVYFAHNPSRRGHTANYAMKLEDVSIDVDGRRTILVFQRGRGGRHRTAAAGRPRPERFREDRRQTDVFMHSFSPIDKIGIEVTQIAPQILKVLSGQVDNFLLADLADNSHFFEIVLS